MIVRHNPLPYFTPGWPMGRPDMVLLHYSAGYSAEHLYDTLLDRKLSAHFGIERSGVVHRYVDPSEARAWHAGNSSWAGRYDLNQYSIGVEIVNFGPCDGSMLATDITPQGDAQYLYDPEEEGKYEEVDVSESYVYWRNVTYGTSTTTVCSRQWAREVHDYRPQWSGKLWPDYPTAQIQSVCQCVVQWMAKFDILPEWVVGHEHVSPANKQDPGPLFPWSTLELAARECLPALGAARLLDPTYRQPDRVRAVQSHLSRMGFSVGWIDGTWGPATQKAAEAAVEKFVVAYDGTRLAMRLRRLELTQSNSMKISHTFRLIPGNDPGRK